MFDNRPNMYQRMESPKSDELLPSLCTGNLFNQWQYRHTPEKNRSHIHSGRLMTTNSGSCRLLNYTTERIVTCLDALHDQQQPLDAPLHLIFMGDSIIRQQYLNFVRVCNYVFGKMCILSLTRKSFNSSNSFLLSFWVQLIPDYDKILHPSDAALLFQGDMEVTSVILRLRLSFRWQPYVSDEVVNMARQWTNSNLIRPPHLVLLSIYKLTPKLY